MNVAIRGLEANLGQSYADTFFNDQHPTLKADFIMANPPFNLSDWGADKLEKDPRWKYGLPPAGNANFAWMQHMIHHLSPVGRIGLVLANGALSSQTGGEGTIRQKIVEADLVEGSEEVSIHMNSEPDFQTEVERSLWKLLRAAAGGDQILQETELLKWSTRHYNEVGAWYQDLNKAGIAAAVANGDIERTESRIFLTKHYKQELSKQGETNVRNLFGFKNYLKDFTLVNEREPKDVGLWKDYLVFAALFGIADEVAKQFKELLPDYFLVPQNYGVAGDLASYDMLRTINMINAMSNSTNSGYNAGLKAAQERAEARSSSGGSWSSSSGGGGGFSSGGGGGGFSGGGSGGGGR